VSIALTLSIVTAFGFSAWRIVPSVIDLALFAAVFGIFTLPGWPLAGWVAGRTAGWRTRTPLALLLGYLVGCTIYLVLRLIGLSNPVLELVACVLVAAALQALLQNESGLLSLSPRTRRDAQALGLLLLIVALLVGPVFARVGYHTPGGLAYRAYFIADLFAHMSVVAELAKGTTPPVNPYYASEPLPYYWTFFSLPAVFNGLHDSMRRHTLVDRGILLTDLTMAGVYVSVWYLALRSLGFSRAATLLAWILALIASSFEGTFFLWRQWMHQGDLAAFRNVNIDAITRWIWDLPPVDGLHRLFWYTPQHGLALTLGLLAVVAFVTSRRPNSLARGALDGVLLGGALACSSFNGLILVGAYAVAEILVLVRSGLTDMWAWLRARSLAAAIVIAFLVLTVALGMIQRSSGDVVVALNNHFTRGPLIFIALSFGPIAWLAIFGVRPLLRESTRAVIAVMSLAVVSIIVFLCVDVRGHENSYVSFRTAQIWYVLLAMLSAAALDSARRWTSRAQWVLGVVLLITAVAAIPTVGLDWFNARDIDNVEMSPGGFPWTVQIAPPHRAATSWIAAHLPLDAKLQADPSVRGRATWALIPAFAERRLVVGLGLFEPNPRRFDRDIARVRLVFRTTDLSMAEAYCDRMGIQYLYVGPEERAAHWPNADKFAADSARFERVYRAAGVSIYRVKRAASQSAQH
jgi:hypothetical protein